MAIRTFETIGVALGVLAGDRAVTLSLQDAAECAEKERLRQEKLARIEKLKAETRALKRQAGVCEKCGCDRCPGCDYDHDCFAD